MAALAVNVFGGGRRWLARSATVLASGLRKIMALFAAAPASGAEAKAAERRRRKELRRKHGV
ncbi:MAG: hypothetical protein AVDCRST_MAG64-4305 [uncultured Phycisphaerae bacterium]|uniref:Uncharacterized protein n=1 Tax=uncultured Phycisphaerae bacterium TaxID=904963 RepID=A0A6J4QNS3_9BACT|nr:MAG: hypothetical protein AVDCRST_MAG64-4305 [uncultured Phycisphaerae bacterium]